MRGLQQDAAYVRSVLDSLSGPVVVAGHSHGGSVMSEAADGAAGVTALVYVASFNLEGGESTAQLAAKFPGGELGPALDSVPFPLADGETGVDLYIQQDRFREVFAADVAPEVAELMAAPADSMRSNRRPSRADPARSDRHLRVRDLGCADAIRRDFDVVGIAILAVITALGGGILRDLILGDAPPPRSRSPHHLALLERPHPIQHRFHGAARGLATTA